MLELDTVIFGGGAAGLWTFDALRQHGVSALLLEAHELGRGQTIASQGIIHGGLKYSLSGLLNPSVRSIRDMPDRWRRSLAGETTPNLTQTRLRAEYCHLWDTGSLSGRLGMLGAKTGLRVKPVTVESHARPEALAPCPGTVARLDEQVVDPISFLADLSGQHRQHILRVDAAGGVEFTHGDDGGVCLIRLLNPTTGEPLDLAPRNVVLTAGEGNESLREMLRLKTNAMQRRPLHMIMARGPLPPLNAHCVQGTTTRLTITTAVDVIGRTVWQIGGQIAEDGVERSVNEQIQCAQREFDILLPHIDRSAVEWTTYRVDRAEAAASGSRPEDISVMREHNVYTAWPTKLALVPKLADEIVRSLHEVIEEHPKRSTENAEHFLDLLQRWPKPNIALPPWEQETQWFHDDSAQPN